MKRRQADAMRRDSKQRTQGDAKRCQAMLRAIMRTSQSTK